MGNQWTVRDGHSRGLEMMKSYKNGVFFFQTVYSSSTRSTPASSSAIAARSVSFSKLFPAKFEEQGSESAPKTQLANREINFYMLMKRCRFDVCAGLISSFEGLNGPNSKSHLSLLLFVCLFFKLLLLYTL